MFKKVSIALMVVLLLVSVSSARTIEGIEFPETLTAGDHILLLNGGGARVAFMNKVYVAGLWLENAMTDPAGVMNADEAMAIRMHVTNDFFASSKNINKAFNNGFRSSMPRGDISSIQEKVDRFKACFETEIKDDDEFDIVYVPDKGVSVYKNGEFCDTIPGYEFKKSVWSIWMHETRPADEDLKEGMTRGNVSAEALAAKEQLMAAAKLEKEAAMAEAEAEKAAAKAEAKAAAEAKVAAASAKAAQEAAMAAKTEAAEMKIAAAEKAKAKAEAEAAREAGQKAAAAVEAVAEPVEMTLTRDTFSNDDVFFSVNSAALSATAKQKLIAKARWMKSNPTASVAVEVTSDPRGSKAYNMALAKKRAKSVVNFMVREGIDASRLEMIIFGEVESADNKSAWASKRKAHFRIK